MKDLNVLLHSFTGAVQKQVNMKITFNIKLRSKREKRRMIYVSSKIRKINPIYLFIVK